MVVCLFRMVEVKLQMETEDPRKYWGRRLVRAPLLRQSME